MHAPTAFIFAALLGPAICAPTSAKPLAIPDINYKCNEYNFENQSTSGSPSVDDCRVIMENIKDGGKWTTLPSRQRTLVRHGSCALGVYAKSRKKQKASHFHVGNGDIRELINESINRFQWNGLVGAKGGMSCKTGETLQKSLDVEWGLFNSKDIGSK